MTAALRLDVRDIAAMLNDRIERLCGLLLPRGVRVGGEWRIGSLAGEPGQSMVVHLAGPREGAWVDFAAHTAGKKDGHAGDALDLVAQVKFRGHRGDAIRWAKDWLGIEAADPETLKEYRRQAEAKRENAADARERHRKAARATFFESLALRDTPAWEYLVGRGVDFAKVGRVPRILRFHPGLTHRETCERDADGRILWRTGRKCPCLIAGITDRTGEIIAVHRTFLERLASDRWVKLRSVKKAKLTLGDYTGGSIPLWRGASGRPHQDPAAGEELLTGEGIEDVGTGVMATPELRAAVAVSLSNMGSMWLPEAIAGVIILQQNDPEQDENGNPHPARGSLARAIQHFRDMGKKVRVAVPPVFVKDFNEYQQRVLESV